MTTSRKLAILVGGGPAPGINSVVAAATIRAGLDQVPVIGLRDGFRWIIRKDTDHVVPLTEDIARRIHPRGGSFLGISRANPTKAPELLENAVDSLTRLGVTGVITIGGDDTAFSAMKLEQQAAGRLRVVHVPKTIDNDLDLPPYVETFGFQTARHYGADVVKTLLVDAETTSRWYLVIAMGRTAGHLALGVGKAAGATLTLIPEEFRKPIALRTVVDTLAGAVIKEIAAGRPYGVAVVAEGLSLDLNPDDLAELGATDRDAHGHIRLAEVNLGDMLKARVGERLRALGVEMTLASKNVGYELRCVDPIPFDLEYSRDLGCSAAEFLLEGGNAAMVSIQRGEFVPVPFADMLSKETGRARVRRVDVGSIRYGVARKFMSRLGRDDFAQPEALAALAAATNLSAGEFRAQFEYLVTGDLAAPPSESHR